MVEHLFDSSQMYRACGMVATDIDIRQSGSFDMFQQAEQQLEDKHLKLLKTVHKVNQKYGTDMLFICSALKKTEQMKHMRFKYPMLECF